MSFVYKACRNSIVTLELLPDSITNEGRNGIIDSNCAKFRTNKAKIISILNYFTESDMDDDCSVYYPNFIYTIGNVITSEFDTVLDHICSTGIHYFKTREAAISWCRDYQDTINQSLNLMDEKIRGYYDNGQKKYEENYKDGKKEGKQEEWYFNGQKRHELYYKNGLCDKKQKGWYFNGRKEYELNYKDGKKEGKEEWWYPNGEKQFEYDYKGGN